MKSDQELISQTQHGDMSAAEELIRRYDSAVYATAIGISTDHHAAEDVTQETFVTAINQLSTLKDPARFGGWVLTIAKRLAIRTSTRQKRYSSLELEVEVESSIPKEDHLCLDIEDISLMKQVALLPEHERIVVLLKTFEGHSVVEIAHITDRPVGTVTKQLSRAYTRLRKQLMELEK